MTRTLSMSLLAAIALAGCGGTEPAANNSGNRAANTIASGTNTNNPLAVTTPTPEATTNAAPTLTPVFKSYCAAMEKKDDAALRKAFSADTLRSYESSMREDGIRSLAEFLSTDAVTTALCEIRNEEITGDTAVADVRTASMPNGGKILFVKEGGDWKLTNRVPGFEKK